jgi:hypothetical protein
MGSLNRRGFLQRLAGALTAAVAVDPEKLLWTPGRVKIFDLGALPTPSREEEIRALLLEQTFPALRINSITCNSWSIPVGYTLDDAPFGKRLRPQPRLVGQLEDGTEAEYIFPPRVELTDDPALHLTRKPRTNDVLTPAEQLARDEWTPDPRDDFQRLRDRALRSLKRRG